MKPIVRLISVVVTCLVLAMLLSTCKSPYNAPPDTQPDTPSDTQPDIPSEQPLRFMSTSGKTILDENGDIFIIKAINAGSGGYEPDAWNWGNPIRYLDPYQKMTEDDYEEIASLGFNAVRLCMDYKHFYFDAWIWENPLPTTTTPVSYDPGIDAINAWKYFDDNIQWAKKYGLKVIPNLHYPPGGYQSLGNGTQFWEGGYIGGVFYNAMYFQDLFVQFWVELASRYVNEPAILAYGLLNEPVPTIRVTDDMAWADAVAEVARAVTRYDEIMIRTIEAIREVDPNHIIIVEKILMCSDPVSGWKLSPGDSSVLGHLFTVLPYPNILYEFHYYLHFNLQYASHNTAHTYTTAENWQSLKTILDSRIAWSQTHNLPVFLGEFGSTRFTSQMTITLFDGSHIHNNLGGEIFLNDILGYIVEQNLNSAYFSWKESNPDGFGLYEEYHWTWKGISAYTRAIPNTSFIDILRRVLMNDT